MDNSIVVIGQVTLCGVVLALVTVWLNHRLAHGRDRLRLTRERGLVVIEAFKPELDALIHTDKDCRLILTEDAYRKHESAVREFIPYLSWVDRIRIKKAWKDFAHFKINERQSIPLYAKYADTGSLDKRRRVRPLAISGIQKIMSYAQQ